MRIEPFCHDDKADFLELASMENWVTDSWELDFLLSRFPGGCCAARAGGGKTAGFVTSLCHEKSGWIGNLIVSPEYRGRKIGGKLFAAALEALWNTGIETVWLTASQAGQPLYEKQGFNRIDKIIRWVGTGRQRRKSHTAATAADLSGTLLNELDGLIWGDRRDALLAATTARGDVLQQESGFIVLQPCGDARQLGPFSALDSATAEALLGEALLRMPPGTDFYLDAPASNRSALRLFNRKRMCISGSTQLMYAGVRPDYRPGYLYGLATMGSCG